MIQPARSVFPGMSHSISVGEEKGVVGAAGGAYVGEDGGGHCLSSFKPAPFV